ncbi:MAG: hypothetical protein HOI47_32820 [Candidatus Scalindua sp.]|nr:hypothetical protein [Candidatus Scalindua sp.]
MEILFNELSLTGQFSNQNDFVKNALLPFIRVLKEMQEFATLLLKKSDVWSNKVTPTINLYSFLIASCRTDEVRRFKSAIANLTKEPFWDSDIKQDSGTAYFFNGSDIAGSSPAEACERDKVVVSFLSSPASLSPLNIVRNDITVPLVNLTVYGNLTEFLWDTKKISFESYLKERFSRGKLDFSRVDINILSSGVQTTEQSLFIDTFRKFDELTWGQIYTDTGLEYKRFHGTLVASCKGAKTDKFRVSQKFRCHGYRENDSFIVVKFETDHKMSDHG